MYFAEEMRSKGISSNRTQVVAQRYIVMFITLVTVIHIQSSTSIVVAIIADVGVLYFHSRKKQTIHINIVKLLDYPVWYADYEELPQTPYRFSMWQYSSTGSVPGIEGNVDLNIQLLKK